ESAGSGGEASLGRGAARGPGRTARSRKRGTRRFRVARGPRAQGPLHAALLGGSASGAKQAAALVEELLEAARAEARPETSSSPANCLRDALRDLGPQATDVVADLPRPLTACGKAARHSIMLVPCWRRHRDRGGAGRGRARRGRPILEHRAADAGRARPPE